jgi:hypothetical protein
MVALKLCGSAVAGDPVRAPALAVGGDAAVIGLSVSFVNIGIIDAGIAAV